ncbi:hypothetical protein F8M41_011267 [Gigaspora margarita]|uniref:Uncharacterized protein n=1 Tax=Gigaspora margarita TaxID=4874 RepID=A0A8H4A0E4_GIGMA|nr:hypothetical protein F8M41_011267 [Gigaspora margarita]
MASDTLDSESDTLSSELDMLSSESNASSSSDQSMLMEEIEPQLEVREESTQTIVDGGISFQLLFKEYGSYFNNFTEMSLFTWVTKHMIKLYLIGSFIKYKDKETRIRKMVAIVSTSSASAPHNVSTLKIILDIYYDDFGTFRNIYHSLGFVPSGEEFNDVMKPIIDEIKILEKGTLMNIADQDI